MLVLPSCLEVVSLFRVSFLFTYKCRIGIVIVIVIGIVII